MSISESSAASRFELAIVDDTAFDAHWGPSAHPERPERLHAARSALIDANVPFRRVQARPALREELLRVHDLQYTESLDRLRNKQGALDADTYLARGSVEAATLAAGGAVELVRALLTSTKRGAALLRPPGHHARPDRAMGFCLLNNVAVAAAEALARGVERVAIIDWDVHHGNGTQEMFFDDPRVLFVSLHQWPFYPGTGGLDEIGERDGVGYNVNVPLSSGAGPAAYRRAFERIVLPVVETFAPELLLVSAGFDAHRDDPLGGMRLDAYSYGWMTSQLAAIADKSAQGRIALFLEGGYDLTALQTSVAASLCALSGLNSSVQRTEADDRLESSHSLEIERARRALPPLFRAVL
jgi:acetoin utilization deacetylase AcuC-like enzyme